MNSRHVEPCEAYGWREHIQVKFIYAMFLAISRIGKRLDALNQRIALKRLPIVVIKLDFKFMSRRVCW